MTEYPSPERSEINGVIYNFGEDDLNYARAWLYKISGDVNTFMTWDDPYIIQEAKKRAIDNETVTDVILQWAENYISAEADRCSSEYREK